MLVIFNLSSILDTVWVYIQTVTSWYFEYTIDPCKANNLVNLSNLCYDYLFIKIFFKKNVFNTNSNNIHLLVLTVAYKSLMLAVKVLLYFNLVFAKWVLKRWFNMFHFKNSVNIK